MTLLSGNMKSPDPLVPAIFDPVINWPLLRLVTLEQPSCVFTASLAAS